MILKNSLPEEQLSLTKDSGKPLVPDALVPRKNPEADCEERLEQAEVQVEQAELRTAQAKTRTAQAEARTEQAETRTEQAKTRTEQAEVRTEEAESRSEQTARDSEQNFRRLNIELETRVAERTAQLEAVNQELETFSYSVSHDLRTPLRHVMAFLELLREDKDSSFSEKGQVHLTTICNSARRMTRLIDDLLAFAHIGKSELHRTEINLDWLTREALGDFQTEIKERNIVVEIHPLPVVQADRALLRMVLVNLISNAVKFTQGRSPAKIEIGSTPRDSETVVFIRDNGAGFDPKYAAKLFGVFQRLHGADEFEGTGIGLANVQRIVHRHGGRVWAEGIEDGGATFYFSIPNQNKISA